MKILTILILVSTFACAEETKPTTPCTKDAISRDLEWICKVASIEATNPPAYNYEWVRVVAGGSPKPAPPITIAPKSAKMHADIASTSGSGTVFIADDHAYFETSWPKASVDGNGNLLIQSSAAGPRTIFTFYMPDGSAYEISGDFLAALVKKHGVKK